MVTIWPSMAYLSIENVLRNLAAHPGTHVRPGETEIAATVKAGQRVAAMRCLIDPADTNFEPLG